jgi:hypothetical protein
MTDKKKIVETLSEEQKRILEKASPTVNHAVGGDFTKIETAERREILLRASAHARQPSMLWTKDRKLKAKFYVKRFLDFHGQLECEFADRASRVLGEVDAELDLAGTNEIYFNLRCEESTLFFHLQRREIFSRNGLLIVRLPEALFEIQRRAQLRYRTNDGDPFRIDAEIFRPFGDAVSVLDVSSGGIGLQVKFPTAEAADAFKIEADLRMPFRLDLGILNLAATGEVRYFRRTNDERDGEPVVRVGLRFVGLPQDTVEAIQILVMERSYVRLRDMFTE